MSLRLCALCTVVFVYMRSIDAPPPPPLTWGVCCAPECRLCALLIPLEVLRSKNSAWAWRESRNFHSAATSHSSKGPSDRGGPVCVRATPVCAQFESNSPDVCVKWKSVSTQPGSEASIIFLFQTSRVVQSLVSAQAQRGWRGGK